MTPQHNPAPPIHPVRVIAILLALLAVLPGSGQAQPSEQAAPSVAADGNYQQRRLESAFSVLEGIVDRAQSAPEKVRSALSDARRHLDASRGALAASDVTRAQRLHRLAADALGSVSRWVAMRDDIEDDAKEGKPNRLRHRLARFSRRITALELAARSTSHAAEQEALRDEALSIKALLDSRESAQARIQLRALAQQLLQLQKAIRDSATELGPRARKEGSK